MERRIIVFDGDDTLWETEPLYDAAREKAALIVGSIGLDSTKFLEMQKRLDIYNVQHFGLASSRFPNSSVRALEILAKNDGIQIPSDIRAKVFEASASVFAMAAPLMRSAGEVLQEMAKTHLLALLTKGDTEIQERRIQQSGLRGFFSFISIVSEKDESSFVEVLDEMNALPRCGWSIGNSLSSDILPAHSLGMRTIWIDSPVWGHERIHEVAISDFPDVIQASGLSEVPHLISLHEDIKSGHTAKPRSLQ